FFKGLSEFMMSRPIVALAVEGKNAVDVVRATVGATDPQKSAPGTIRGDFGLDIGRNLIHASDSPDAAARELAIFFNDGEMLDYERETDRWITE
ncbi:MAG: nucleoside-diphosphate kinase, partial [Dehalococcoidia bacterium]